MAAPELKLVRGPRTPAASPAAGPRVWIVSLILAALAIAATAIGVGPARRPLEARELAGMAVQQALDLGNEDPGVRATLVTLRRTLGERPLDSQTRAVYASLLLGLSRSVEDTRAAAAHASRAAVLSPVSVPIVRRTVLVLVRGRDTDGALKWVRDMFGYDAGAAARLLARIEPLLFERDVPRAIPDDPAAWLAWSRQLRIEGDAAAAEDWARRTLARWPDDLPALRHVAATAVGQEDWAALELLFPEDRVFPDAPAAAPVLLYRARLRAELDDSLGARADIERALRLDPASSLVQVLAGEALLAIGAADEARRRWNRVLFSLPADNLDTRGNVLRRLARLEETHGEPAAARRAWRAVLEVEPDHAEATRRVRELSGME